MQKNGNMDHSKMKKIACAESSEPKISVDSAIESLVPKPAVTGSRRRKINIEIYKTSADSFCRRTFLRMQVLNTHMREVRDAVFVDSGALVGLKDGLCKGKAGRRSNTFTTSDGRISVKLGFRACADWDSTVEEGVMQIRDYLAVTACAPQMPRMRDAVLQLLERDGRGNLRVGAVARLEEYARKLGDPRFTAAVAIIRAARRLAETSQFITVCYKDEQGVKRTLPLSLTAMEE